MKYNPTSFGKRISRAIEEEIRVAMAHGLTNAEAAIIVAHMAISSALGFHGAAMGKARPTPEKVRAATNEIIGIVAAWPDERH